MGALEVLKMNMGEDSFYIFCIMLVATLIITIVKKLLKLALVIGIIIAICMGASANATTTPQPPTTQHIQSNYYATQTHNPPTAHNLLLFITDPDSYLMDINSPE